MSEETLSLFPEFEAFTDEPDSCIPSAAAVEPEQVGYYSNIEDNQVAMFENFESWKQEWQGMPSYDNSKQEAFATLTIRFSNQQNLNDFAKLIGQDITESTKSIWYPKMIAGLLLTKVYADES